MLYLPNLKKKRKLRVKVKVQFKQSIIFLFFILVNAEYFELADGKDDEVEKENSDEEKVEIDDDIEDDIDEEMDEGTDYARDYFDNGEGYLDEDDNLEEGEAAF